SPDSTTAINSFRRSRDGIQPSSAPRNDGLDLKSGGPLRSLEYQRQIVGGHLDGFDKLETGACPEFLQIVDIAHAPFGVLVAKAFIERGIAGCGMLAAALERPIEEQPPSDLQVAPGAGKQPFRDPPWRYVDHIGAEHRQQICG